MKISLKLIVIYTILGFIYYFFRNKFPIEITNLYFRNAYRLSILISAFLVPVLINFSFQRTNKYVKRSMIISMLCIFYSIIMTFYFWTFGYVYWIDKEIIPPSANSNKITIVQFMDEGAFGSQWRQIEAYEIMPGLRYVINKQYIE